MCFWLATHCILCAVITCLFKLPAVSSYDSQFHKFDEPSNTIIQLPFYGVHWLSYSYWCHIAAIRVFSLGFLNYHFQSPWNVLIRTRHCLLPNPHQAYRLPRKLELSRMTLEWFSAQMPFLQIPLSRKTRQQLPRSQIHQWLCFSLRHLCSRFRREHWFNIRLWYWLQTASTSIVSTSEPWSHQSWKSISKRGCATDVV